MRLSRLQHNVLLALDAGEVFNATALSNFNAAVAVILGGNRDATDTELLALEASIDQMFHQPDASGGSADGESNPPPASDATVATEPSGDQTQTGVEGSEAGGDVASPEGQESVTAVAPPEAVVESPATAPAESPFLNEPVDGEPVDAPPAPSNEPAPPGE